MSPELPPELLPDILCRLPVKVLLQIRCVSKPWCRLIDSPFFIKTHLNRSDQSRKNHFLLLTKINSDVVKSVDLEFLDSEVDLPNPIRPEIPSLRRSVVVTNICYRRFDRLQIIAREWQIVHDPLQVKIRVWGSSNGLVLISNSFSTCLWNPSTRKHRNLPSLLPPLSSLPEYPTEFRGFGYDSASDDYKVIKFILCINSTIYAVWVYSLRSNSWREIRNSFPPNIKWHERQPGVLIHEALHWPVKVKSGLDEVENDFVVAFDLKTEEYRMFPQPKCQNANFLSRLGAFNGSSLCLVYSYMPVGFEIWVMMEQEESWTRVTLERGDFISYPGGFINSTVRDGQEVLLHRNFKFASGNSCKLTDSNLDICMGSLVSPDGGAAANE